MSPTDPPSSDLTTWQARAAELRRQIEQHNAAYHTYDALMVSDAEYDTLLAELRQIEASHPELHTPDSPTQRVGGAVAPGFGAVRHTVPMLSLANAFTVEGLRAWHERISRLVGRPVQGFTVEPKIDGLAVTLRYVAGQLQVGATRGDGRQGEDVTNNLRTISDVPQVLRGDFPPALEVRGEVYLPRAAFERVNDERLAAGQPPFANPRNCAAGSLRQLDPAITASRPLQALYYALAEADGWQPPTQWEVLQRLPEWGFPTDRGAARVETMNEAIAACVAWEGRRHRLAHDIDGVVLKVDDLVLQAELGAAGTEPRWAIAYKFPPAQATTRLEAIGVNVGRTGSLTPFAILQPVQVGGVTLRLAVLHNESDIHRKDIRAGDTVLVQRAGEVMPYVIGPLLDRRPAGTSPYKLPERCPVCGAPVSREEAVARCTNDFRGCPAQLRALLAHFCSRGAMDIQTVGDRLAGALVAAGLVQDPGDLYTLTPETLAGLERLGERSARRVVAEIEASTRRPFAGVLFALGIRHVGARTAERLADSFGSLDALQSADVQTLAAVEGIGPVVAQSVYDALHSHTYQPFIEKLTSAGVQLARRVQPLPTGPLAGLTLIVTGRLHRSSRQQIEQRLAALGATVAHSVTRATSYLVVGADPGSKLARAQKLGTPTLTEEELETLIHQRLGTEPVANGSGPS